MKITMDDIYKILAKHFFNESSNAEEAKVTEFRKNNPAEYKMLDELWKRGDIKVIDYDIAKAWEKVQSKVKGGNTKVIPIYTKLLRIAAVAAILISGMFSIYYFTEINTIQTAHNITVEASEKTEEILLADGSKVWLNKGAVLIYPKKFDKNKRNVELKGEAFFEIAKNKDKPFIVNMSNSTVEVLGTSFNINSNDNNTEVIVSTGKVKVSDIKNAKSEIITVGYSAKVVNNTVEKYQTENLNYLAWKTGEFVFNQTTINQVVQDLNTFYKKQIVIENNKSFDCRFTANFKQAQLQDIIDVLKLTCNIEVKNEYNKYTIK